MLTTQKLAPGTFETYWRGELTRYVIINGVLRTNEASNVYGYCWIDGGIDRKNWCGTLKTTKARLADRIRKDIDKGEPWQRMQKAA